MSELKRCPFCGCEVGDHFPYFYFHEGMEVWVLHHNCPHENDDLTLAISVWGNTREEAVERWNHRAEVQESESL